VDSEPVYVVWSGEVALSCSIAEAWSLVLDYPSWQGYSRVERLSGGAGEEGELVLLERAGPDAALYPPYLARTIFLEPRSKIIWKTQPRVPDPSLNFTGFVEFRLYEAGVGTQLWYNLLYEFVASLSSDADRRAFRERQYQNFDQLFRHMLPKLQALAAARTKG
jgi:hypothetical protein